MAVSVTFGFATMAAAWSSVTSSVTSEYPASGEPDRAEDIQAVAEEPLKPVASFLMSERIAEHDKERMLADGSKGRVSVKEKLAEMREKVYGKKAPEKTGMSKRKEVSLE